MRVSRIALAIAAGFAVLWIASISTAQACDPIDYGATASAIWCEVRYRAPSTPTAVPTAAPVVVVAAAQAPAAPKAVVSPVESGGDSPNSALEIDQKEHTIEPGGHVWYRIGVNGAHIIVRMHTNGAPGLGFKVYAPDQQDIWSPTTKPRADVKDYSKNNPNDLIWAGGQFLQIGTWYALVTNTSANALTYRLDVTQQAVEKVCTGPYWENLPGGAGVYWNLCQ